MQLKYLVLWMNEILEIYFVFAAATSVTSSVFLFWPALKDVIKAGVKNEFTNHPVISVIAYTFIAAVFSPVLFMVLMYPPAGQSYMQGLSKVLREEKS